VPDPQNRFHLPIGVITCSGQLVTSTHQPVTTIQADYGLHINASASHPRNTSINHETTAAHDLRLPNMDISDKRT